MRPIAIEVTEGSQVIVSSGLAAGEQVLAGFAGKAFAPNPMTNSECSLLLALSARLYPLSLPYSSIFCI